MKIKPQEKIRLILKHAVDAVNPFDAVKKHIELRGALLLLKRPSGVKKYSLDEYKNIYVIGAGKAAPAMAEAAESVLGYRINLGLICTKYGHARRLKKIKTIEAGHPLPDESGLRASAEILSILNNAGRNDLVISLISGGASALLPMPAAGISLKEKIEITETLLKCGASIHEINCIRKHLSLTKGGGLASAAWPADVINLIISDVTGNSPAVIASGPFSPDDTSPEDAMNILSRYSLLNKIPPSIIKLLEKGSERRVAGKNSRIFKKVENLVIASNIQALEAAAEKASELGYKPFLLSASMEGDVKKMAREHLREVKKIIHHGIPVTRPACLISGGEAAVKVKGKGKGGRNMEFVLHTVKTLAGMEGVTAASAGTDGTDGPTEAAGAFAGPETLEKAGAAGMDITDYIKNNDSFNFFKKINNLIITGPTGTNVMDIRIFLID